MSLKHFFIATVCALTLAGCADGPNYEHMSASQLYQGGEQNLASTHYELAIKHFEALQANYPFGDDAQKAQLQLMYAYYKHNETSSAVAAADRFIRLYPRNALVDYAYYIKGLSELEENRGVLMRYLPLDLAQRDLAGVRNAFNDFSLLLQLFPGSPYAGAARQQMVYLRDILAKHEIETAQYYMLRQAYVAAANRATYVINHFQHAPSVENALVLSVKANMKLKQKQSARDAYRVLQLNYPHNKQLPSLKALVAA